MLFYIYPTSTVFIDDDKDFLAAIASQAEIKQITTYTQPKLAIEDLIKANYVNRIPQKLYQSSPKQTVPYDCQNPVNFNPWSLHEEIYNENRFKDIAVIVVDYYMDDLDGIEVCQQLKDIPVKKILLTGGADKQHLAIEAFNRGLIHKFVNKSDHALSTILKQSISILTEAYFADLNKRLLPPYIDQESILINQTYANFVRNLQLNYDAVEYYLLDSTGSCLFLTHSGDPVWIIVKNSDELSSYEQIALDQDAPNDLLDSLSRREQLPFFFSEKDFETCPHDWNQYLYPARPLPGLPGYYYAIYKGHIRNNLKQEKIYSYNHYLTREHIY